MVEGNTYGKSLDIHSVEPCDLSFSVEILK